MHLESLLRYYQDEMEFLVEGGKTFAKQYPTLAKTLDFSSFSSSDPDTQRLIESIAFLNAKLQKRLDEQVPEISQQILNAIYPQFISPIPSFTIMNFSHVAKPTNEIRTISRNTTLTSTSPLSGQHYTFKTTMDVIISPWQIQDILLTTTAQAGLPYDIYAVCSNAIVIKLEQLMKTITDELVFYIHMSDNTAFNVYEAIMSVFCDKNTPVFEDGKMIGEVEAIGFSDAENLFPTFSRENPAYRILLEYNAFYQKFLFFKVKFKKMPSKDAAQEFSPKEIVIPFNSKKEIFIKKGDLLLNCTPAINLFEKNSEPITVNNKSTNYLVLADHNPQKAMDIHSILSIENTNPKAKIKYNPYFSCKHVMDEENHHIFWLAKRGVNKQMTGYETTISFLDTKPDLQTNVLYAKLLCIQRDANNTVGPEEKWNIGNTPGNLECINLDRPTPTRMPAIHSSTQWRLISHLAINHFGFNNSDGLDYIKELLAIYDFQNSSNKNPLHDLQSLAYKVDMISHNRCIVPKANIIITANDAHSAQVFLLAHIIGMFFSKILDFNTKLDLVLKKQSNGSVWKKWNVV